MTDLTEKQLLTKKMILEQDIAVSVQKLTSEFQKQTGIAVWDVNLTASNTSEIGYEADYAWEANITTE